MSSPGSTRLASRRLGLSFLGFFLDGAIVLSAMYWLFFLDRACLNSEVKADPRVLELSVKIPLVRFVRFLCFFFLIPCSRSGSWGSGSSSELDGSGSLGALCVLGLCFFLLVRVT